MLPIVIAVIAILVEITLFAGMQVNVFLPKFWLRNCLQLADNLLSEYVLFIV